MAGFTEVLTWALCSHAENFSKLRQVGWAGLEVVKCGLGLPGSAPLQEGASGPSWMGSWLAVGRHTQCAQKQRVECAHYSTYPTCSYFMLWRTHSPPLHPSLSLGAAR